MSWTLPNILTLARICLTPVLALLPFIQGYWPKVIAFLIFIAASASDVVDGYLARRRNQVSELGQLLDPIADKLLLFATLIPIFWLTRHPTILVDYRIPWWGSLPVWVALLLVGRELLITAFRFFAKRRGVVIPAMGAGKLKAVVQNVFIGATLFWFAWKDALAAHPWAGWFRNFWDKFHGAVVAVTLGGAILLTVYSLVVYLYRIGATLFWFAWKDALAAHPWAGWFRNFWDKFHGAVVAVTLGGAILLTVYSLVVYLYRYRTLLKGG